MVEYTQLEKEWERPAKFESGKQCVFYRARRQWLNRMPGPFVLKKTFTLRMRHCVTGAVP